MPQARLHVLPEQLSHRRHLEVLRSQVELVAVADLETLEVGDGHLFEFRILHLQLGDAVRLDVVDQAFIALVALHNHLPERILDLVEHRVDHVLVGLPANGDSLDAFGQFLRWILRISAL